LVSAPLGRRRYRAGKCWHSPPQRVWPRCQLWQTWYWHRRNRQPKTSWASSCRAGDSSPRRSMQSRPSTLRTSAPTLLAGWSATSLRPRDGGWPSRLKRETSSLPR